MIKINGKRYRFNIDRFLIILYIISAIILLACSGNYATAPTTWRWHDACESGMTWNEYMEMVQE